MRIVFRVMALAFLPLLCGPTQAEEPENSPAMPLPETVSSAPPRSEAVLASQLLIETLFRLQDESAMGVAQSLPRQKDLLTEIGKQLLEAEVEDADDLAFHIAGYALSGGNPEVVDRFLASAALTGGKRRLLEACAAYMRGDRDAALSIFSAVAISSLPAFLSGRIALARAVTLADDQSLQQRDLQYAIAAMPGTLVEESALRRSALGFAQARKEEPFFTRLDRYCRRFPNSLYGEPFWEDITGAFAAWEFKDPLPRLERLKSCVRKLPEDRRSAVYLGLARKAALAGQQQLTQAAAGELRILADPGSSEYQTAQLYANLYAVATADDGRRLEALSQIVQDKLDPVEKSLLMAATTIGRSLNAPLSKANGGNSEQQEPVPLLERGDALLREASGLLDQARS